MCVCLAGIISVWVHDGVLSGCIRVIFPLWRGSSGYMGYQMRVLESENDKNLSEIDSFGYPYRGYFRGCIWEYSLFCQVFGACNLTFQGGGIVDLRCFTPFLGYFKKKLKKDLDLCSQSYYLYNRLIANHLHT